MNYQLKQFRSRNGTMTYILSNVSSKEAILIDPVAQEGKDMYLNYFKEQGLQLRYIVDTHTHADHVSGSLELREATGAQIVMHTLSPTQRVDLRVSDGDVLRLGDLEVKVLYTPGHTNESISLAFNGMLFTGDVLLIGGTGRTDFQLGNSEALYESIKKLLSFPDETRIYPGHEYKGKEYSTVGEEKATSPRLQMSKEEFVQFMDEYHPELPDAFDESIRENTK